MILHDTYTNSYYHYQLDNLTKVNSWFNDTILTNIQLNSYLDLQVGASKKTWVNRDVE